jgi:hypothetical protein
VQPVHTADNSAILVVPNVKVQMEAQYAIPSLSLHDLLGESLSFYLLIHTVNVRFTTFFASTQIQQMFPLCSMPLPLPDFSHMVSCNARDITMLMCCGILNPHTKILSLVSELEDSNFDTSYINFCEGLMYPKITMYFLHQICSFHEFFCMLCFKYVDYFTIIHHHVA